MLIDYRLHQFLSPIQKGLHISYQVHLINEMKNQGVNARLCLLATSLTEATHRLNNISKQLCCTIFLTSISLLFPISLSRITLSKSAREFHTLPPAKLCSERIQHVTSCQALRQNSAGPASVFRLRLATCLMLRRRNPCRLMFSCLLQLENSRHDDWCFHYLKR